MSTTQQDLAKINQGDLSIPTPDAPETQGDQRAVATTPATEAAISVLKGLKPQITGNFETLPFRPGIDNTTPEKLPLLPGQQGKPELLNNQQDFQQSMQQPKPALETPEYNPSQRFGTTFGDLLKLKGLGVPLPTMTAMVLAGNSMLAGQPVEGQTTGAPAAPEAPEAPSLVPAGAIDPSKISNADQTRPTTPLPQQDQKSLAAKNALESFAAGAGAEGSPFNAISKNLATQREQQTAAINNAASLAHTMHEQMLVHQLGEEQVANATKAGQMGADMMMNAHHPGELRAQGKTSEEIKNMIAQKKIDTTQDSVFQTGRVQIGTDNNGMPMFRSTYSVVRPGGPVTFDDANSEERDYINKNLGLKEGDPRYIPAGTTLPANQANLLWKQASIAEANEAATAEAMTRAGIARSKAALPEDAQRIINSDAYTEALHKSHSDPTDPFAVAKAFQIIQNDPKLQKELNLKSGDLHGAFSQLIDKDDPKAFDTYMEKWYTERQKSEDRIREMQLSNNDVKANPVEAGTLAQQKMQQLASDSAKQNAILNDKNSTQQQKDDAAAQMKKNDEDFNLYYAKLELAQNTVANKREEDLTTEEAKKKLKNAGTQFDPADDSDAMGEAYFNMLPEPKRAALQAIYEGRDVRSARSLQDKNGNFTPVALALHRAYPDYNLQKAVGYGEAVKQFESDKPHTPGYQLNAGATTLKHLSDLNDIAENHWIQIRNPLSDAAQQYNTLLDKIAGEMLDFYGEPKTNETIATQKKTLGAIFASRPAAIKESAIAMGNKFESIEQTWNDASPTPTFRPPMPGIDKNARAAARKLMPEYAQQHPQLFGEEAQSTPTSGTATTPAEAPTKKEKADAAATLPKADPGFVTVQIPGKPPKQIPNDPKNLAKFKAAFPTALIGQ